LQSKLFVFIKCKNDFDYTENTAVLSNMTTARTFSRTQNFVLTADLWYNKL